MAPNLQQNGINSHHQDDREHWAALLPRPVNLNTNPNVPAEEGPPGPPSSPISDNGGCSPTPPPEEKKKDDDDDSSAGGHGRAATINGATHGSKTDTKNGFKDASTKTKTQAQTQKSGGQKSGSTKSKPVVSLNAAAPAYIPQSGRFEQLVDRDILMHTKNWQFYEGKIPCGFSQRAKFFHGGYTCSH